MEPFLKPEEITSVELLEKEIRKVMLMADEGLVKMIVSVAVGNRLPFSPLWLMIVAGSSGGKSMLISMLSGLKFFVPVSDLTVNTFASGQRRPGQETSLLMKLNNSLLAFKDFTTLLSKDKEAKTAVLGQLREIYDGEYVKRTGNGQDVTWRGKVGAIAGCTEYIYKNTDEMSAMGDRFVMYAFDQPDRIEMTKFSMRQNGPKEAEHMEHIKKCVKHFVETCVAAAVEKGTYEMALPEETEDELMAIADFATQSRSAVFTNFKSGLVEFVPEPELPTRVIKQMVTLAKTFIAINLTNPDLPADHPARKGTLTEAEKSTICKTAFDSIPRQRRNVIVPLAEYVYGVTTSGMATALGLPTETVRMYLIALNALGVCDRLKSVKAGQGDTWKLKEKFRPVVGRLKKLKFKETTLEGEGGDGVSDFDPGRPDSDAEALKALADMKF